MNNSFLYRMPSGIPGDVSRKSHSTIESHMITGQFAAFGLFGKINAAGDFTPLEAGDADAWIASAFAVCPSKLLLPPEQFSLAVTRKVSEAGNISVLEYIKKNCISMAKNGKELDIQPSKWCVGRGAGGTDRMMTYTQSENRVRFPMVPLQRTPIEYRDLRQLTTYFGRLGVVEWVYPETAFYADGL